MKTSKSRHLYVRGLTLLELLVALVLSTLVLAMLLPMLSELMHPAQSLEVPPQPPWKRALAADIRQLVSPAKCAQSVLQIIPPTASQPMPELVLQTYGRLGSDTIRGPSEVRYRLQPVQNNGPYALIRTAHGWHDRSTSELVLAEQITGWSISANEPSIGLPEKGAAIPIASLTPSAATMPANGQRATSVLPVSLSVELETANAIDSYQCWVTQLAGSPPESVPDPQGKQP